MSARVLILAAVTTAAWTSATLSFTAVTLAGLIFGAVIASVPILTAVIAPSAMMRRRAG